MAGNAVMLPRPKLYTASKIHHAEKWQILRSSWKEIEFISRWIDMGTLEGVYAPPPHIYRQCWLMDRADVLASDYLLCYAEESDHLRGALVEAGMALASGIPVYTIGTHVDYGTWRHHPLVRNVPTLEVMRWEISGEEV
jgi:hypothetical protein